MEVDRIKFFNNNLKNVFLLKEYNNYGNLCVYVKNIDLKFIRSLLDEFLIYMQYISNKCLEMSSKFKKKEYCIHIYLDGCTHRNFSLPLFKKINKVFLEEETDVVNTLYIYNKNPICIKMIELIKQVIDKDTRKKIVIIKQ
tara:strand:+ start:620 stop:1042 length:423 start_codon:yes stop_codon:yes gene_type:complete